MTRQGFCYILLVSALVCGTAKCNTINNRPENQCSSVKGQDFIRNHYDVLISTGKTFFKEARTNTEMSNAINELTAHFSSTSSTADLISCAKFLPDQEAHTTNSRRNIEMLGLGETFQLTNKMDFCIKEIDHTPEKANRIEARRIIEAINTVQESATKVSEHVLKGYGLTWNGSYPTNKLSYQDPGHHFARCDIYKSHAYYSNNTWGVYVSVTNTIPSKFVNDKERPLFGEFISDTSQFNLRWQWCENTNQAREEIFGTGLRTYVDGPLSWSLWGENPITDNPALKNAQDFINFAREMIQDIDSAAATAILLVPAVLCLFPLSLFHDTSVWTVFAFMVVTDVVSILPVLLRGIELVSYARRKEYSMISWVYGNTGDKQPGAAETWVASCHLKKDVLTWGIVFISFAFFSMITGIVLELVIVRYLNKLKKTWAEQYNEEPKEGAGLLYYLRYQKKES